MSDDIAISLKGREEEALVELLKAVRRYTANTHGDKIEYSATVAAFAEAVAAAFYNDRMLETPVSVIEGCIKRGERLSTQLIMLCLAELFDRECAVDADAAIVNFHSRIAATVYRKGDGSVGQR